MKKFKVQRIQGVIVPGFKEDLKTIEALSDERTTRIYVEREDCEDYFVEPVTGTMHYPIKNIAVNGISYRLKPGWNDVPPPVYEFWQHMNDEHRDGVRKNHGASVGFTQNDMQAVRQNLLIHDVSREVGLKLQEAEGQLQESRSRAGKALRIAPV